MDLFKRLFGTKDVTPPPDDSEKLWQRVYDARAAFVEQNFGKLPNDIQKIADLLSIWPGGGLFAVPAEKLGSGWTAYMTFGLSNPDMPTQMTVYDVKTEYENGMLTRVEGAMKRRDVPRPPTGRPGYGYELMVIAEDNAFWPLSFLQWPVKMEMLQDADLIGMVERYDGLTVERIGVAENRSVNVLIAKARLPLPSRIDLPTGSIDILIATVITDDEMRWSMEHGRSALLAALLDSEVGQRSILDRPSVVSLRDLDADFSTITSREAAKALADQGKLFKILMFPTELGGHDVPENTVYVPRGIPEIKNQLTRAFRQAADQGQIDQLTVNAEYKDKSSVPARLILKASHSERGEISKEIIEIW